MSKRKYGSQWFNPENIDRVYQAGKAAYNVVKRLKGSAKSRGSAKSSNFQYGRRVFPWSVSSKGRRKRHVAYKRGARQGRKAGRGRFKRRGRAGYSYRAKISFSAPYNQICLGAGRIAGTAGSQLLTGGAVADSGWDATATGTPSLLLPVSQINILQSILDVGVLGAPTLNAIPAAANFQRPDRFRLNWAKLETTYQNVNNYGHNVTLYYCKVRRDILNVAAYDTIDEILSNSFVAEGSNITGGMLQATPFMAHMFCSLIKIYHVKKVFVGAGDEMIVRLSHLKPRIFDINRWSLKSAATGAVTYTQEYVAAGGITKFVLYRVQGVVGNDSTTKTSATVTTGAPTFDFKTEIKYQICSIFGGVTQNRAGGSTATGGSTNVLPVPAVAFNTTTLDTDLQSVATAS